MGNYTAQYDTGDVTEAVTDGIAIGTIEIVGFIALFIILAVVSWLAGRVGLMAKMLRK